MHSARTNEPSQLISKTVSQILEEGSLAVLVTMVQAPEGMDVPGQKLLISGDTRVGSLGENSAALEDAVAAKAADFLNSRDDTTLIQVKEFAPDLAQWGEATLLFERIQA